MLVLGIDEAGRGPVIGPMVIAGVLLDEEAEEEFNLLGVRDSKLLSPKKRERLAKEIKKKAVEVQVISVPAAEIDKARKRMSLNEIEAAKMALLLKKFKNKPEKIIIDLPDPTGFALIKRISKYVDLKAEVIAEHKADSKYVAVAAASIIAKTERDKAVERISKEHGEVGSGYPSDPRTVKFLEKHKEEEMKFVRYSWSTARRILGKKKEKKQAKLFDF